MTSYEWIAIIIAAISLGIAIFALIESKKANRLQQESAERKKNEFRLNEIRNDLRGLRVNAAVLHNPISKEVIDHKKLDKLEYQIQALEKEESELEIRLQ